MNSFIISFCLIFLIAGCAVKKHEEATSHAATSNVFPNGISESDNGKFLVYLAAPQFTPHRLNTLVFHLSTLDLTPIDAPDYDVSVSYFMPDMPSMHIDAPSWKMTSPGILEATFNISMPGDWRFWVTVSQHGVALDTYTRALFVPFTHL